MILIYRILSISLLLCVASFLFIQSETSASEQSDDRSKIDLFILPDTTNISDFDTTEVLKQGHLRKAFKTWVRNFEKNYTDVKEELKRFTVWLENHEFIQKHNNQAPPPSFRLGHNQFSDLTNEEYRKFNFLGEHSSGTLTYDEDDNIHEDTLEDEVKINLLDVPDEVDWVKEGAVTGVKNQGKCGACWSFSATGAIEGAKFIKDGELISLSEQFLVDCDPYDNGCYGGSMNNAFKYTRMSGGICTESAYPYVATKQNSCMASMCNLVIDSEAYSKRDITRGNAEGLIAGIAQQPVSIGIESASVEFQFYKSGVFNYDGCGSEVDHGVLAVGYGHDEYYEMDFWKVKNSWGSGWGEEGYIRIARNTTKPMGYCGILRMASYPIV